MTVSVDVVFKEALSRMKKKVSLYYSGDVWKKMELL